MLRFLGLDIWVGFLWHCEVLINLLFYLTCRMSYWHLPVDLLVTERINVVANVVNDHQTLSGVRELHDDALALSVHFLRRSRQNHSHQLLLLVHPHLQQSTKVTNLRSTVSTIVKWCWADSNRRHCDAAANSCVCENPSWSLRYRSMNTDHSGQHDNSHLPHSIRTLHYRNTVFAQQSTGIDVLTIYYRF